ncbi:FkbM family methyltransferase [Desulfitobacterium hafniense]|uniref:FkbM family methyltransferase n=1 Tax=Desulfitobacterium hafniense TaxID=49338 RepID=UPI0011DDD992
MDDCSSIVVSNGETSICVTSLDEFFANKKVEKLSTFIKLDIEGAEKTLFLV